MTRFPILVVVLWAFLALGMTSLLVTQSLTSTLSLLLWVLVIGMVAYAGLVFFLIPQAEEYCPTEDAPVPDQIDREHPLRVADLDEPNVPFIQALNRKIAGAENANEVGAFVRDQISNMRRLIVGRYAPAQVHVEVLALTGVIGLLLGSIGFVAEASALLQSSGWVSGEDVATAVSEVSLDFGQRSVTILGLACATCLLGLLSRACLGGSIDFRRNTEIASLDRLEYWVQTQIVSRLKLQSEESDLDTVHAPRGQMIQLKDLTFEGKYDPKRGDVILRPVVAPGASAAAGES